MSTSDLKTIGVIGIGVMGNGIAQVTAQSGFETVVMDVNDEVVERGMAHLTSSLDRLVKAYEKSGGEKGISPEAKAATLGRLRATTRLEDLLACDLIIEAVPERVELKEEVNRKLAVLGYDKLLVSNTSGISITRLGPAYGKVITPEVFLAMRAAVEEVYVDPDVRRYIVDLAAGTRRQRQVVVGVSPRGSLALLKLARAWAALQGRDFVVPDDIKVFARPALAHRLVLDPNLWGSNKTENSVIDQVMSSVRVPVIQGAHE